MRQRLKINAEFLLPEGFTGGYPEALELYTQYIKESWDNQLRYPVTMPDSFCFPYTVNRGGRAYTTFSIESFRYEELGDDIEADEEKQEELENELCLDSDQ